MKIVIDNKSGRAEIKFSWKEVWLIFRRRKLTLDSAGIKKFGGTLLKIVMDWNLKEVTELKEEDVVDPNKKNSS